jgi:hypothetical protein
MYQDATLVLRTIEKHLRIFGGVFGAIELHKSKDTLLLVELSEFDKEKLGILIVFNYADSFFFFNDRILSHSPEWPGTLYVIRLVFPSAALRLQKYAIS